jgi:hypothetical protein
MLTPDDRFQSLADTPGAVQRRRPRPVLNLPNLQVRPSFSGDNFKFFPTPQGIEISIRLHNSGPVDSGPFMVLAKFRVNNNDYERWHSIPNLPALATETLLLETVADNPGATGLSIRVMAWLDPPSAAQPWGQVYESDEQDNYVDWEYAAIPPSKPFAPRPEDFEERPDRPELP